MTPIIRTTLLRGSALFLALGFGLPALHATTYVYVANAADGTISTYQLAEQTGKLTPGATVASGDNVAPMAVSPDHRFLYANVDSPTHAVQTFTIDPANGALKKISQSLARIEAGDYGFCDETGEPIGLGRLLARPTATLSLEAQQRRELKQKMFGD